MRIYLVSVALIALFFLGCGNPKVDASSDELMKSSLVKVRQSLPEEKQGQLDDALKILTFSQVDLKSLLTEGSAGVENVKVRLRKSIHGKTGEQIIADAAQLKIEREKREREQALQEIKELETKREASTIARKHLKNFMVLRSRFYKIKDVLSMDQAVFELKVKNNTEHAVSRVVFYGTIASPNRSIPWHQDFFNYTIPGGLEPGEEASWKLSPNTFSDWTKVKTPQDAVFTVTVERIDGADGNTIYSTTGFGENDEKRLSDLKEKYGIK